MKPRLSHWMLILCVSFIFTLLAFSHPVFADTTPVMDEASDEMQVENPQQDSENTAQEQPAVIQSVVKKAYIVANKKARINWTKSAGADGYILYRRTLDTTKWTKVATLYGESQTYGYDPKVEKKTYSYTVKAFKKIDGKNAYADMDEKGFKVSFKKNTVASVTGDYKSSSVYGPKLNSKQLLQVRTAVQKFCDSYITSDMSDLEKVIAAQLYMARTCIYAPDWSKNGANTAWGALVYKDSAGYHEAQCSGYARGMKALCDGMGVDCRYVHANEKASNPSHQWVEIKMDKKWYIVDPQCNSASGFLAIFLCSGDTYTGMTGMTWDKKSYPTVSSKDYSYEKIEAACSGYKITRVYNKLFK